MKVHILDPRLVEQTLGIPCRTRQRRGSNIINFSSCWFEIGPGDEKLLLSLEDQEPDRVHC